MSHFFNDRGDFKDDNEAFFVYRDKTAVKVHTTHKMLKILLTWLGLDPILYGVRSLRIGRTSDLIKFNYKLEDVKRMGCWRSSTVFKYIRQ